MTYLGIDPSQRSSGVAWLVPGGQVQTLGRLPIERIAELPIFDGPVTALIECPTWSGDGTREVRAACIAWERLIRRRWPRQNTIRRVDPRVWQKAMLGELAVVRGTKTVSLLRARSDWPKLPSITEDEADALCILRFLMIQEMVRA